MTFNTTPNQLTLVRMAFVPVVIACLFQEDRFWHWIAAFAFSAAGITDYFDGYIARTQKVVTVYGKLMDPLADKFLVVSALVMLQHLGTIHPLIVIVLICREIAITGLRALASAEGVIIPASGGAKWKTLVQMFALPFLMAPYDWMGIPFRIGGMTLMYLSLGISLWSAKDYVVDFFKGLRESRASRALERKHAREARLASRAARMAAKAARSKT
jgi:CDP-diacylglycerol--glycerol-3-phosphate 3-phosphatidyltransferase